jgi:glutamyl/glutaminyl-tRNA synthetase
VCELVQDRARTLHEVTELADFFYTGGVEFPLALVWVGMGDKQLKRRVDEGADLSDEPVPEDAPVVTGWLEAAERRLIELDREWTAERVEEALRALVPEIDSSTRKLFGALRVALTGRTAAPPLFETMEVLDRAICLERIGTALDRLREGHQRQRIDSAKATPTSD